MTTKAPVIVKHTVTVQVVTPKAQPGTHRTVHGMDVFALYNYSAGSAVYYTSVVLAGEFYLTSLC